MTNIDKYKYTKLFRDPLYKYVKIDYKFIGELINTYEFQRLKKIKQLGGVFVIYHTAEHSRFTHSLGTYQLAYRFIEEIKYIKDNFIERDKLLFLCSSLLHDIGHGPFSHTFETIFNYNHENKTIDIIVGNTEVNKILSKIDKEFANDIASIIKKDNKYPIIESLISSQLDIDRLDYLQRDSYNLGIQYGLIDIDKIINSIRIKDNKICFKESSIFTIEDYLVSRYNMYWQVYYHPKARSFDIMLEKFIKRIIYLSKNNYSFNCDTKLLINFSNDTNDIFKYLKIDDSYINYLINNMTDENDLILSNLSNGLNHRNLFKYVEKNDKNKKVIKELLNKNNIDLEYFYEEDSVSSKAYNDLLPMKNQIHILKKDNKIVSIKDYSIRVEHLITSTNTTDSRIFYLDEN